MEATTSSEYQVYKLSFSSNQTVAQVKEVVENLTKLPISNQQWLGWPHFVTPATTLEESHINYPVHDFKLKPSNSILKHTRRRYNTRLNVSIFCIIIRLGQDTKKKVSCYIIHDTCI